MLSFFWLFSCTDQGCIEADDFGEYQSQTIEVSANAAEDSCNYDSTLSITDAGQGPGIKACLTSGTAYVVDEAGLSQSTTSGGCNGKQADGVTSLDATHLSLCISNCVQSCLNGSSAAGAASPEANWKPTDKRDSSQNIGVQILPGSQISVTASGTVTLSDSASYPNIFIPVDELLSNGMQPNYSTSDWSTDSIFDVTAGQSFNMKFNGHWNRGGETAGTGYYNTEDIGGGNIVLGNGGYSWDTAIRNGGITLVAYTIPHPSGYSFDYSKTSDISGTKGTPLLPDPRTWTCDYDSAKIYAGTAATFPFSLESSCYNKTNGYYSLGYSSSVDTAISTNSNFTITSSSASNSLGYYGGPIRWSSDGIADAEGANIVEGYTRSFDTGLTNQLSIPSGASLNSNGTPLVIGSESSSGLSSILIPSTAPGLTITNNDSVSYMMFTRSNSSDGSCDNSLSSATTILYATTIDSSGNTILSSVPLYQSSGGWGEPYYSNSRITLGPGQKVRLVAKEGCNNGIIAIKFVKYQDITITQSGFVRFTTLNASSGTCTLNGRIINPEDSNGDSRENNDSSFYEYDDFTSSSSIDPLNSLIVPTSGTTTLNWSNKVFVRKGQKIRLSPISWNGKVLVNGTSGNSIYRQCGIGMVMQIIPRPALLCKGIADESISTSNSNCLPDTDLTTGTLIGCKAYATECSDSSNSTYYCPYPNCQSTITCTAGTSDNLYTKTNCTESVNTNSTSCNADLANFTFTEQQSYKSACTSCSNKMLTNAQLSAHIAQTLEVCYDLESYTGRVADIPVSTKLSPVSSDDPIFSKGAKRIASFNGYYGNFAEFKDTGTVDSSFNNNRIYQSLNVLSFAQNSRLRFLTLTNNGDFRNLDTNYSTNLTRTSSSPYSANSARGSSYTGLNGVKVAFEGTLQFSNGQWLEAKICREDSTNSCRSLSITGMSSSSAPTLVEIEDSSSTTNTNPTISATSNYKFDAYGVLVRTTSPGAADCTAINQGVATQINSDFYCHTYLNSTSIYLYDSSKSDQFSSSQYDELNKLRLTFKIKDPEVNNCTIPDSDSTSYNGIILNNPAYQAGTYQSNVATDGNICTSGDGLASLSSSSPCIKQFYCGSKYSNNSGKYYVTVKVANPPGSNISNIIGGVITPIIETMDGKKTINSDGSITQTVGQTERIYNLVVQDDRYQAILSICLSLMITFYGVTYLMGVTDLSSSDLINRCIKIALIYFFASPTGWYWFNLFAVKWFKDGTDYIAFTMASSFDDSPEVTRAIALNDYYDKSVLFSSVDRVFGMFFSQAVQKKISALLFASIFGWVYLIIIYFSFLYYVYAVGYAVLYYLTAQIFISILFTLGPIFFIFTLFNQTKGMFDSWLNQLIGFSLQQIFLLTTLAFFNMMMYEVLKMSLGYKICWDEVWTINIITRISLLSFWTIASIPPSVNTQSEIGEIGHPEGIPSLFSILFIWVVASLMESFVTFMTDLGSSIGGSISASKLASGALDTIKGFQKYTSDRLGDIYKGTVGEGVKRLDSALFDSGEHAEKIRKEKEEKNRKDQLTKESLSKAGNQAMTNFKRENASAYSKMSDSEKKSALEKVRNEAVNKQAKKLGISKEELNRLKSDKGLKYEGSNLFAAAFQAGRQGMGFGGGTLTKSMDETKVNTKMSISEAKDGMSRMSKEERSDFIKRADNKEVRIDRGKIRKAMEGSAKAGFEATKAVIGASPMVLMADLAINKGNFSNTMMAKSGGKTLSNLKSVASGSKKIAGKAANFAGFNEYSEATSELEKSSKISKMAVGTNWARPESEKQAIREQMQKNREEKKLSTGKGTDSSTMADLKYFDKRLSNKESNPSDLGIKHAFNSRSEKSSLAKEQKISENKVNTEKVEGKLNSDKAEKSKLENIQKTAQIASSNIKKVQSIDSELAGKPEKLSMLDKISGKKAEVVKPSEERAAELEKQKAAIIENDSAANGGSGYFENAKQVQEAREKLESATTPEEKQKAQAEISAITSKENYIESEGNGLNNANATYQLATQKIANIETRTGKNESFLQASKKSAEVFEKAVNSPDSKEKSQKYDDLKPWQKGAVRGIFASKDVKKIVKDQKEIDKVKKDYGKLAENPSSKEHEKFAKKYEEKPTKNS